MLDDRVHYAMITHTDAQIGRILDTLEKSGKAENTIVVFSSDNGLALTRHGLMGKQNVYDHSVHVPLIVTGPGIPKGEVREQLCYIYDIYPTLCERAGLKTPDPVEFKSLNNTLANAGAKHRDHLSHAFMSWQRAVRDSRHKLIEYCVKGERHTQLFDLTADPAETNNLANNPEQAPTLQRMRKLLEEERHQLNDGNTPYPFTNQQGKDFWEAYESGAN
jgi:arylsulfatase A-like enzyme